MRRTFGLDGGGAVAADKAGNVYVAWHGKGDGAAKVEADRQVWIAHSADGRLINEWNVNACPMSSMAFVESGDSILGAWETAGQVYFGRLDAVPLEVIEAPGDAGGRKHPRLAANDKGQTMLIWTEGTGWRRGRSMAWQVWNPDGSRGIEHGRKTGIPTWSFGSVVATRD